MKTITKNVGGYIGALFMDSNIEKLYGVDKGSGSVTWPWALLVLNDTTISLRIGSTIHTVPLASIRQASVTKMGAIHIASANEKDSFGFAVLRLSRMLSELEARGVGREKIFRHNIRFAYAVSWTPMLIAILIVGLVLQDIVVKPLS